MGNKKDVIQIEKHIAIGFKIEKFPTEIFVGTEVTADFFHLPSLKKRREINK